MKKTNLMRVLSSRNCSKIFSARLNKAFDEAIENGSSELVDANNDLAIATVGNDIVVEDKINNEVTKFVNNPEVANDMVMEAIVDETEATPEDEAYCDSKKKYSRKTRKYSETEEPAATEEYKNTPVVGLSSDTHEINTLPEVEVVVNEGVIDNEASGTIPFSLRMRNIPKDRIYSITKAVRKAFSGEEEVKNEVNTEELVKNIANEVTNKIEEKVENIVNEVVEEVKTESKRTRKAFCDGGVTNEMADNIVNAVVNEVKNIVENAINNVTNEATEETKEESKKFAEEVNEAVNKAVNEAINNAKADVTNEAINNAVNEAVNNVINNAKNAEAEEVKEVENIKNEIKNEVVEEVTDELEQLVNDAVISPAVEITETEENIAEKTESKKFSATASDDSLSKMLNYNF